MTKAFAHCPGCPGQPLAKTIMYEDDEIPCDACTKALPLTRLLFKDNTDVDNACKQCWKSGFPPERSLDRKYLLVYSIHS